jgi:TonB family protein
MSRLEKKCVIGSAALHGLLLVTFLVGSAFIASKPHQNLPPVITLFDAKVTDRLIASGGNPNATPTPAAPTTPKVETPQPPPPEPVQPVAKPTEAEPKQAEREVVKKPDVAKDTEKVKPPLTQKEKTKPVQKEANNNSKTPLSLNPIKHTNETIRLQREMAARSREKAEREAWDRYNAQRREVANKVGEIVGNVKNGLSHETVATVVGPGGAAYANYSSLIIEKYKAAVYATHPQSDDDAEAVIRIVVARDGTVRSSQWVKRTGNSVLDKTVDRAMNSVRSLPGFPPEAKDSERSFSITIAFDAKRVSA